MDYRNTKDACDISYKVKRLDNATIGDGLNFRSPVSYEVNGTRYRDLIKYYGIRIFIESKGIGYAVNFASIILQISSGLALLVVATTICDVNQNPTNISHCIVDYDSIFVTTKEGIYPI